MSITEDHLEQLCLDWFCAGGYSYAYGPDLAHDGDPLEILGHNTNFGEFVLRPSMLGFGTS